MQTEELHYQMLEFVEFRLGENRFGISVTNVREIIQPVAVTTIPHAHPYVKGIIQLRGEVLPLIDFNKMTGSKLLEKSNDEKFIVGEFDEKTVVFEVSTVTQIERVNFMEIEKVSDMYEGEIIPIVGVIKKEDGIIFLVDFEKMIVDHFS